MLGLNSYPTVYAGDVGQLDSSQTETYVTIYVTAANAALQAAVATADTNGTPYTYATVPHSYAEMENLTLAIAGDKTLASAGVTLTEWGPDPTTGMVTVHVATPSVAQLSMLASALGVSDTAVTAATYPMQVQALLQQRFGAGVVVAPDYSTKAHLLSRRDDTAPA